MERLGMRHVRDIIVRGEPYVLYMLGRGPRVTVLRLP
jgi:hypothetical protein